MGKADSETTVCVLREEAADVYEPPVIGIVIKPICEVVQLFACDRWYLRNLIDQLLELKYPEHVRCILDGWSQSTCTPQA